MCKTGVTPKSDRFVLNIHNQDGESIGFKLRKTTPLRKLMDAYAKYQKTTKNHIKFIFNGKTLHQDQTAEQFQIGNGDQIQVYQTYSGA